jgi:phage-related minor tail protein
VHNAIATLSQGKWVTYLNNVFTTPQADQALLSLKSASGVYAKGGAFDGGVQAFASGGVVTGPTYAPIALFGEAGPEAIMPLHRDESGSLGVKATLQMPQMPQQQGNIFLLEELRSLRREVSELRASNTRENVAIAIHAANTASSTRKMERNGVQVWTDPAEPILTQVAA